MVINVCPGYNHVAGVDSANSTTLQENTCTCENGVAATGAQCTEDGAVICISCNDNFTLDGNTCNLNSGYYLDNSTDPPTVTQHNTCNGWVQTPGDATTDAVCGTCTDIANRAPDTTLTCTGDNIATRIILIQMVINVLPDITM